MIASRMAPLPPQHLFSGPICLLLRMIARARHGLGGSGESGFSAKCAAATNQVSGLVNALQGLLHSIPSLLRVASFVGPESNCYSANSVPSRSRRVCLVPVTPFISVRHGEDTPLVMELFRNSNYSKSPNVPRSTLIVAMSSDFHIHLALLRGSAHDDTSLSSPPDSRLLRGAAAEHPRGDLRLLLRTVAAPP
jgi:hypothetical protein